MGKLTYYDSGFNPKRIRQISILIKEKYIVYRRYRRYSIYSIAIESSPEWNLNHEHWIRFRCMYYPEKQFTFLNFFHDVSLKCLRITFRSTTSSSKLYAKHDASSGMSFSKTSSLFRIMIFAFSLSKIQESIFC